MHLQNGVWRVQGSLAISRAIGDIHLKEWIISEPEIRKLPITSDCEFLILASDGLWDKVTYAIYFFPCMISRVLFLFIRHV